MATKDTEMCVDLKHKSEKFNDIKPALTHVTCKYKTNSDYAIKPEGHTKQIKSKSDFNAWLSSRYAHIASTEYDILFQDFIKFIEVNYGQDDNAVQYIGTTELLEGFFNHIEIVSSVEAYQISEFPMTDYHFNTSYRQKQIDGRCTLNVEHIPSIFKTYKSWIEIVENKVISYKFDEELVFEQYQKEQSEITLKILNECIVHLAQDVDYIREIIEATIADKSTHDQYYRILKHWMWCVKRRALGLPIIYPMMIVFSGGQGVGKSTLINRLVEVFKDFVLNNCKLSNIVEERSAAIDSLKLIWIFDEMPYADKTAIEPIKQWVTMDTIKYRPMGTNSSIEVVKRSMGIGSQNKPLGDTIQDSTGNRRFADFPVKQEKNKYIDIFNPDHKYYEDFQEQGDAWVSIWQDIDESLPRGYVDLAVDKDIMKIMNNNYKSTIEYKFYSRVLVGGNDTIEIRRSFLYEMYVKYVKSYGSKAKSDKNFIHDFTDMCKSMDLKYETRKKHNVPMVTIPKLNSDYRELFKSIDRTTPAIIMTDSKFSEKHYFNQDELYCDIKKIKDENEIAVDEKKSKTKKAIGFKDEDMIESEEIVDEWDDAEDDFFNEY